MKVGDLAKETGLSVRALHHYDETGLLKPSARSESGHRIYTKEDALRLQKIVCLRDVGFSLEEIHRTLGDSAVSVMSVIERHLESLEDEIQKKQRLLKKLGTTADFLRVKNQIDLHEILGIIKEVASLEKYLSPEQADLVWDNKKNLGQDEFQKLADEMIDIISKIRTEMDRGTPSNETNVKNFAKRWKEIGVVLSGGDPSVKEALQEWYRNNPVYGAQYGVDQEMMDYVQAAIVSGKQ